MSKVSHPYRTKHTFHETQMVNVTYPEVKKSEEKRRCVNGTSLNLAPVLCTKSALGKKNTILDSVDPGCHTLDEALLIFV